MIYESQTANFIFNNSKKEEDLVSYIIEIICVNDLKFSVVEGVCGSRK
jgi:hypothetical protein